MQSTYKRRQTWTDGPPRRVAQREQAPLFFYSKAEIDLTLSDYTTSAQLHNEFYSKVKMTLENNWIIR